MKDINALRDDMMELKPTFLAGVPRVLERIHEGEMLVFIKLHILAFVAIFFAISSHFISVSCFLGVLKGLEEVNPRRRKIFHILYN